MSTKKDKLTSRANYISSLLQEIDSMTAKKVSDIMGDYKIAEGERVVICDAAGQALFDSDYKTDVTGKYIILPEIMSALSGIESCYSGFPNGNLESRLSVPIVRNNEITGAVYLYEIDYEQSKILRGMRRELQLLSFILAFFLIAFVFFFSNTLVRRMQTLLNRIRDMTSDSYGTILAPKGNDELAQIFDEFNNMSQRLQATEELRRTFVSDASHELRTPLSSIRLLTDSILQTPDMDIDTVRDFLKDIGEEIDRLTRIAEKLLVLTRLDGAKKLELTNVDISKVTHMTLDTLEPIADEAGIEIRRSLSDNIYIKADGDGAHQIVFNLVENAIKYNNPGGYVHVLLFERDNICSLIIDDTGIGIPEEHYDKIFERFYRVDKARSRMGKGGTGLGLAIVHRNVESYNGTVHIEKSPAGGTRFIVEFPSAEAESEAIK